MVTVYLDGLGRNVTQVNGMVEISKCGSTATHVEEFTGRVIEPKWRWPMFTI
jgi:hypothetical protein